MSGPATGESTARAADSPASHPWIVLSGCFPTTCYFDVTKSPVWIALGASAKLIRTLEKDNGTLAQTKDALAHTWKCR